MSNYRYNDGGRAAAGFKGKTGDCVARSIAIVTGLPYRDVYDRLAEGNATQRITKKSRKSTAGVRTARNGISVSRKWFRDWMASLGFHWTPVAAIGKPGCKTSDFAGRTVIARQRRHYVAIVDGVVNDIWDSSERVVYGYWSKD